MNLSPKGHLTILTESGKVLFSEPNLVTNEIAEFLAGVLSGNLDYKITGVVGQYGTTVNFPPNGGPYITPADTDTYVDLTPTNVSIEKFPISMKATSTQEGQALYSSNSLTCVSAITKHDASVYIGAGLICELPSKVLLLAHTATTGLLKQPGESLLVVWEWVFSN